MGGGNKEKKIKREVGILQGKQKLPLRPPPRRQSGKRNITTQRDKERKLLWE